MIPSENKTPPWSEAVFKKQLLSLGKHYHIHHPYNKALNAGMMNPQQIQNWVANRFYYQIMIPIKDAAILSNCPDREVRRQWIRRITDHDGVQNDEGGIEAWIQLGIACGLSREEITSTKNVLPGVRFAVDAYVNFCRTSPWQEAVCASLTELFAPEIHKERLANWPLHYPWIDSQGLQYFRNRLNEVPRDVDFALATTLHYFRTREQQEKALNIVRFKLDVLWSISDQLALADLQDLIQQDNR